jgi:hypothetical protein
MKKLWNWKWRSIPVGIVSAVLILCLVAGSAFAAYSFLSGTADIEVIEAFTLRYSPDNTNWYPLEDSFTLSGMTCNPGESWQAWIEVKNDSSATLHLDADYSVSPTSGMTLTGDIFAGVDVPHGTSYYTIQWSVDDDAPPGTYTLSIEFYRG